MMDLEKLKNDYNNQENREGVISFFIPRLKEEFKPKKEIEVNLFSDDDKTNKIMLSFSIIDSSENLHIIDCYSEFDSETSTPTILDIRLHND